MFLRMSHNYYQILPLKSYGYTAIFTKGDNISDFLFAVLARRSHSKEESNLQGKNLLQKEQILSFKS